MPRPRRLIFPNTPNHVIHRGHRRREVFFSDSDRVDYLGTLGECRVRFGIRVYAYCLMTNHVHFVLDPGDDSASISLLMKRLAGRHARRINVAHSWSGALWESRFKCSPIDSERYLLACGRYVDQNPVRAGMVARPDLFPWSSYRARAGLVESPLLDSDPALEALSTSSATRAQIYRILAGVPVPDEDLELIRGASQSNQLTGDDSFIAHMRKQWAGDLPSRKQGRPKKAR